MNLLSTRQKQILEYLQQTHGVLSSALLSERFDVSVQTIRKDMNDLSDKGMVRRVHGGISLPSPNDNLSFRNRDLINLTAKQRIAQKVAQALAGRMQLFFSASARLPNKWHKRCSIIPV